MKLASKYTGDLADSELVLNPDGSIYHLHLKPEDIADTIILVGDQYRVERISAKFDSIELKISNREFVTHTGRIGSKRLSVLSTGIGTDNIDIVLNELDALVNLDLKNRQPADSQKSLNLVRLGTCGALNEEVPTDGFVCSRYAIGFDGLLHFYRPDYEEDELQLAAQFKKFTQWPSEVTAPYAVRAGQICEKFGEGFYNGITATAGGFYGPQGRSLRLPLQMPALNQRMTAFSFEGLRMANFEMETSALLGLSGMLGHNAATVCAVVANRYRGEYSRDYKKTVDLLIDAVLERLTA